MKEFMECAACRAKPGCPTLCEACLHNRALFGEYHKLLNSIFWMARAAQRQSISNDTRSRLLYDIKDACRGELPDWYKAERNL